MRLRRRSRHEVAVPVVLRPDDEDELPVNPRDWEIADLRLQEQSKAEANDVGDWVAARLLNEASLHPGLKMSFYRLAGEHFRDRFPPDFTRIFVDAAFEAEASARADQAAARAALKAGEKAKPKSP